MTETEEIEMTEKGKYEKECKKFILNDTKMEEKVYYTYIMSNKINTVLYIGVTNDLYRRVIEHKNQVNDGFTKKYNVDKLVYYECLDSPCSAIDREKQLKKWRREKKNDLIIRENPYWEDLSKDLFEM